MGALLFLEVVLQVAAFFFVAEGGPVGGAKSRESGDQVRILCVGESTTHGFGEVSYPTLLEELLAEKIPERSFEVINAGLPATHSLYLASQLESWLTTYRPDWVVVMMGINDEIYFTDLEPLSAMGRWEAALLRSRVYKLALLLWDRFAPGQRGVDVVDGRSGAPSGLSGVAPEAPARQSDESLRTYRRTFDAAREAWFNGDRDSAAVVFADLIAQARRMGVPGDDDSLEIPARYWSVYERSQRLLAEFLVAEGRSAEALELLNESVRLHPRNLRLRRRLIWLLDSIGADSRARAEEAALERLEGEVALQVTVQSWRRVLATVRRSGIPLVAVQYPLRSVARLRQILGDADDVIYVENREAFQAALDQSGWDAVFMDRFSGDFGHATELGNSLIAAELVDEIFLPRYGKARESRAHP